MKKSTTLFSLLCQTSTNRIAMADPVCIYCWKLLLSLLVIVFSQCSQVLNSVLCYDFVQRLWPSLGLVLAITLSDVPFKVKNGDQRGMESSSPLAAVGVCRRELLDQIQTATVIQKVGVATTFDQINGKNEGVVFGLNSLKFEMHLMCPSVTPDCVSKNWTQRKMLSPF